MPDPTIEEDLVTARCALDWLNDDDALDARAALDRIEAALREREQNPWGDDAHHVYEVIRQRYRGGETVHELAVDYGCTTEDIARALVDPHNQCPTATCARNAGHGGICWPKKPGEGARRQGSDRGSTV